MRLGTQIRSIAAAVILLGASYSWAQDNRFVTGQVTSITVDDPTESRGFSRDERRYAVRIGLTGVPENFVLGFGQSGSPITPYMGMLDLLKSAMENGWTVQIRLNRDVSGGSSSSHAAIVSVTVRR